MFSLLREMNAVSDRPGLGAEPVPVNVNLYVALKFGLVVFVYLSMSFHGLFQRKKEPVVWDHATYKQAVRKAMFARFKELE